MMYSFQTRLHMVKHFPGAGDEKALGISERGEVEPAPPEKFLNALDEKALVCALRHATFEFGEQGEVELRPHVLGEGHVQEGWSNNIRLSWH